MEIEKLKEHLMQEIQQLEAQKEEAIKEASECSEQHMDTLRDQLIGWWSQEDLPHLYGWWSRKDLPCLWEMGISIKTKMLPQ